MEIGEDLVNDVAESNLLVGIKNGDSIYTRYWLDRRNKKFRRLLPANPPAPEEDPAVRERKIKEAEERIIKFQERWFKKDNTEESTSSDTPSSHQI